MKHLNFLSKSSSRSMGHRVTTLASTVGSPSAHRRGTMLKLLSVLVLVLTIGVGNVWGADPTAAVNDYLWREQFTGTTTSTSSFSASSTSAISGAANSSKGTSMLSNSDISNLSYTASNVMLSASPAGNCSGAHIWLKKDANGVYFQVTNIPIYNAKKVKIIWNQAGASSVTAQYKLDNGDWTNAKTNSSAAANITSDDISTSGATTIGVKFTRTNTGTNIRLDDLRIQVTEVAASCANKVTISAGTNTNCTFTLTPNGQQESCDGVATTVSITPTLGYGNPTVTQSGASKTPTISGTGNTRTITYQANTTGTSTIAVSCSANTYTITLNKDLTPTTAGTASITATYNSSNNLTSAITKPTATGWTFGGYYTAKNGGGTQIIDADGNVKANVSNYTDSNKKWIKADNVTLYAKWTRTVTWSVNGLTNVYPASTVTYNATASKVASIPTAPNPASYCGDKFVGWSQKNAGSESKTTSYYDDLFTTVAGSPDLNSITTDVIFYAVFADYDE